MKRTAITALAALLLAGCGEASTGYDHVAKHRRYDPYVAEPRRVPKPQICSDYANERQILLDEQAGRLTKADKQWLDMDGDGRYCEESRVEWKGERAH
jgi:hypothetical protein